MFTHDIIKILYTNLGYLPGYPFWLIDDSEMFNAFVKEEGVFEEFYPCPSQDLSEQYGLLKENIFGFIVEYQQSGKEIPDWVYSYMLLQPITYQSSLQDIEYLFSLNNMDVEDQEAQFNEDIAKSCYQVSVDWMKKQPWKYKDRVPTMFGEAHVVKSLRLEQANILTN